MEASMRALFVGIAILSAVVAHAHPGSAIAVGNDGTVYFVDTGGGVFAIARDGTLIRREGPAFHWFAFDPDNRFARTSWPAMRDAEFRSAGTSPTLVLSSDFPVTIGADRKFYYPDGTSGNQVRIVGIDPSGTRTVRATLPPIQRGGETIRWINGLAPGASGTLYYTEDAAVRRIDANGRISPVAVNVAVPNCAAAIPGTEEDTRPYLRGLALAADGSIYVAASACAALLRVDSQGKTSVVLRSTPPWSPTAVATSGGNIYVLEYLHTVGDDRRQWIARVRRISASGGVSTLAQTRR
jgi:hypothetical protein